LILIFNIGVSTLVPRSFKKGVWHKTYFTCVTNIWVKAYDDGTVVNLIDEMIAMTASANHINARLNREEKTEENNKRQTEEAINSITGATED